MTFFEFRHSDKKNPNSLPEQHSIIYILQLNIIIILLLLYYYYYPLILFVTMAANTAPVKWAQRKDSLYVTIALADVKDYKVDLTDRKLVFQGTSDGKLYKLDLEFVSSKSWYFLISIYF